MIPKRLITHGCSFTYGEELSNPSASCWPRLIADSLDIELLNLAKPSYSNDGILEDISAIDLGPDDLVIICWTTYLRIKMEDANGWWTNTTGRVDQSRSDLTKALIASIDQDWLYKRWLSQVLLLQGFLDNQKVKWLFFNAFDNQQQNIKYKKKHYDLQDRISKSRFVGWPDEGFTEWAYPCQLGPRGHPLEEGHQKVAKRLMLALKEHHDLPRIYL